MKNKKLFRAVIISGFNLVLMAVLFLGITTAKYSDAKVAYSSFGAASFNAVILGENTVLDMANGTVNGFGRTLLTQDYRPGMVYSTDPDQNTAKTIPFSVANGVTVENASQVGVNYTVRLRTTKNIPFRYSMLVASKQVDPETGTAPSVLYTAVSCEGTVPRTTDNDIQWYEWKFVPASQSGTPAEAAFELKTGGLDLNQHVLVLEWPITDSGTAAATNSGQFMKEVELLEIRVTASSRNSLNSTENASEWDADDLSALRGKGSIELKMPEATSIGEPVTDPESENEVLVAKDSFSYRVDYRSFYIPEPEEEGAEPAGYRQYDFSVNNSVGHLKGSGSSMGISDITRYRVYLKVPYTTEKKDCVYTLQYEDLLQQHVTQGTWASLTGSVLEYRLYNEYAGADNPDYGSYSIVTQEDVEANLTVWEAPESTQRLYKILRFSWSGSAAGGGTQTGTRPASMVLYNKLRDSTGAIVSQAYSHNLRILLEGIAAAPENLEPDELEILIDAEFIDTGV